MVKTLLFILCSFLCARGADSDLMLWLKFDDSFESALRATDSSGWTNDAVAVADEAKTYTGHYCPVAVAGKVGSAAAFRNHGTNEYYQVYNGTTYYGPQFSGYIMGDWLAVTNWAGLAKITNGTIACWVMFTNSDKSHTLISGGVSGETRSWHLGFWDSETLRFQDCGTPRTLIQWPDLATNIWWHIAVAWSGADNRVTGYTNGVACAAVNTLGLDYVESAHPVTGNQWISVGTQTHGGTWNIDGDAVDVYPNHGWGLMWLDELRVYRRELSTAEIVGLRDYAGLAVKANLRGAARLTKGTL